MLNPSILGALRNAVDSDGLGPGKQSGLITAPNQLQTYECDGLTAFRVMPGAVVLPRRTEQVQAIVRICAQHNIPFVARGAGTGLSGGALPAAHPHDSIWISQSHASRVQMLPPLSSIDHVRPFVRSSSSDFAIVCCALKR